HNRPVFFKLCFFHAHRAGKASATGQCTVVIEKVGISPEVDNSRMVRKCTSLRGHHYTLVIPGAGGAFASGISDMFRDWATRKKQIVKIVALIQPRPLFVGSRTAGVFLSFAFPKGFDGIRKLRNLSFI